MSSNITTSQTIGPFPHEGWRWAFDPQTGTDPAVIIEGKVHNGSGQPVGDALIEAWLPQAQTPAVEGLPGLHRVATDDSGSFRLALPQRAADGEPAAYVTLFCRGLLKHQFTALFLSDDTSVPDSPLLAQVPAARRATLVAERTGPGRYRWDIRLQGDAETAFFDYE